MARNCPNCGAPLDDDARFCGSCGSRLPEASPAPRREAARTARAFSLQLAMPAAFCAGRRSPLEVRFQAQADIFAAVAFRLMCSDLEVAAATLRNRPGTAENRVALQVTPQVPGGAALELQIALTADGASEPEVHVARFVASVDEPPPSAPTLNLAPQVIGDRAAHNEIGTLNVNIAGGALGPEKVDVSRYDTLRAAETMPTTLLASPSRLTLRAADGQTVQLLADTEVPFGRNRDNAVVTRIFGADGQLVREANEGNVSRFHFKLTRTANGAGLTDLESTYGTQLNGMPLTPAETVRIPVDRASVIAAGRPGVAMEYTVHPFAGGWNGLAGLVLKRGDRAPERVVLVWSGRVPYADGAFQRDGGRWLFVEASGAAVELGLAVPIRIGGREFTVMPFHHPFV